jgi:hypothetical protein
VVPCSWRQLQAIEGLVEPTYQLRVSRVNEAGGLGAVDCRASAQANPRDDQSQHNPDGGSLDNKAKGLTVVHLEALGEPTKNPMSHVLVQRAIRLELVFEDPLVSHHIGPRRPGDQVPHAVRQHGLVLLHSATPVGVHKRTTD